MLCVLNAVVTVLCSHMELFYARTWSALWCFKCYCACSAPAQGVHCGLLNLTVSILCPHRECVVLAKGVHCGVLNAFVPILRPRNECNMVF